MPRYFFFIWINFLFQDIFYTSINCLFLDSSSLPLSMSYSKIPNIIINVYLFKYPIPRYLLLFLIFSCINLWFQDNTSLHVFISYSNILLLYVNPFPILIHFFNTCINIIFLNSSSSVVSISFSSILFYLSVYISYF